MTFAVDMLNYGAAAQTSFKYNTNDLANNELTDAQKGYATGNVQIENTQVKGEKCVGATLLLENRIQLNFIYKTSDITEGMYAVATYTDHYGNAKTVNIAYDEFGKYDKDNVYTYIPVVGAAIADCSTLCECNDITLQLYDADGNLVDTSVDSVESYCVRGAGDAQYSSLYTMIMKLTDSAYALLH